MTKDFDQLKMAMTEKTIEQQNKIEMLTEQLEMATKSKDKKPRRVLGGLKKFGL